MVGPRAVVFPALRCRPAFDGSGAGEALIQMSFYARAFAKCPTIKDIQLMSYYSQLGKIFRKLIITKIRKPNDSMILLKNSLYISINII